MREVDQFFLGKRVWSLIKDEIIANYMHPYLAKVNKLGHPILLIDGFAGPGIFDDGTEGSPLHMCAAAERFAPGNYTALFVNHSAVHHNKLAQVLRQRGYLSARPVHGRAEHILAQLPRTLGNRTVLLYLDPFGLSGYDFDLLKPFLQRGQTPSTELIVNVHMPIVHRLAARNALNGSQSPDIRIKAYHRRLNRTFGGDYWREALWDESLTPAEREWRLIEGYANRLRNHLPYVGFCPVREAGESRVKYFVVFASRHQDALLRMSDITAKAYYSHIHKQATAGGLWENSPWTSTQYVRVGGVNVDDLQPIIEDTVAQHVGESREEIWLRVASTHFMRFTESEYNSAVRALISSNKLRCTPDPKTHRLNKSCPLYPASTHA